MPVAGHGIHLALRPGDDDALAALTGPDGLAGARTVGLAGVLGHLNRTARHVDVPGRAPVDGFTWNDQDNGTRSWYPQGLTTSADASASGRVAGRELVVASWYYKKNKASRVTFVDVETLAYRHVLVVRPGPDGPRPLPIHAGGVLWYADHLHLAATRRGLFTCRVQDVVEVEPGPRSFGYRFLLPVRHAYAAQTDAPTEALRYSFVSVDRGADPPQLIAGEYGVDRQTTRIVHYPMDPGTGLLVADEHGATRPTHLDERGIGHMQGVALVGDTYYATVSRGRSRHGHLYSGPLGRLRPHRWALPPGPEDISYWPQRDQLWSLSEHPGQRYVFGMDRRRLEPAGGVRGLLGL